MDTAAAENPQAASHAPAAEVTTKDWVITMLITFIPIVGFIMLFVWAFSSGTKTTKANWAKAALIWLAISIMLSIVFSAIFGATMFSMFGGN